MNEMQQLGKDIQQNRIESGMSQEALAKKCKIERSQLSRIEKGLVDGVTYITISKIYEALGISILGHKDASVRPFVKWAGGKTQLLKVITELIPTKFNRYFEPFVGGGALLFKLQPKDFTINDMNAELICAYKCFTSENNYKSLMRLLQEHETKHSEEYYYKIREMDRNPNYDKQPIYVKAARMIYLNKSDFNGLYRVNRSGYFNVPFGQKEKVKCFDVGAFDLLREFFEDSNATILSGDFVTAVKDAKKGDFVYFDPPYDIWENKESFTSYNENEFGKKDQTRLADLFKELDKRGVYVMLSNHNTKFINELYKGYNVHVVPAKRMINANAKGRGAVEEVIITNYDK